MVCFSFCDNELWHSCISYIHFPLFIHTGGKGVKKTIKKVASGLVRDAERSWFAELSDKGNFPFYDTLNTLRVTYALQRPCIYICDVASLYLIIVYD